MTIMKVVISLISRNFRESTYLHIISKIRNLQIYENSKKKQGSVK